MGTGGERPRTREKTRRHRTGTGQEPPLETMRLYRGRSHPAEDGLFSRPLSIKTMAVRAKGSVLCYGRFEKPVEPGLTGPAE